MGRAKEILSPADREIGEVTLDISIGVVRNVLDAIDQGATTKQIRESLDRIKKGKAIIGQDTGLFVLGVSPDLPNQVAKEGRK